MRRLAAEHSPLSARDQSDLAAAVEMAIGEALCDRTQNAIAWFLANCPGGSTLVAAGGVAANTALRQRLSDIAIAAGLEFVAPPLSLCTDNAAMVAWAGLERLRLGLIDDLAAAPRPRWPLDPSAQTRQGTGVKREPD